MSKTQKLKKLKKLSGILKSSRIPSVKVIERIIEKPIERIEKIIEKPTIKIIREPKKHYLSAFVSILNKVKKVGLKQKDEAVRLEKKIDEAIKAIQFPETDIKTPLSEINEKIKKVKEEVKEELKSDIEKVQEKVQSDLRNRIRNIRFAGGNANRNIGIDGNPSVLSRYTDMNIKAGSGVILTYANDDNKKNLDLTITAIASVIGKATGEVPSMISSTEFLIDHVASVGTVKFYEGNRRLTPTTDFSVSGSVITLTYSPPTESDKLVDYEF